jgi:hypothetical protein
MPDLSPIQRIQFEHEIHSPNPAGDFSTMKYNAALAEKPETIDMEEQAVQTAESG